jgi:RHS repeat-associated protein
VEWEPTNFSFVKVASSEYGIPAGHWRLTESRGDYRRITYFDGLWRPVIEREYDNANASGTQRFRGWRYDAEGRVAFEGYPRSTASNIASFTQGVTTTYDALGRVTQTSQDSELGALVTTTAYLSGFKTRVTNPRGYKTLTEYLVWDEPSTDWPVKIVQAEGQAVQQTTEIARNALGNPTGLTRSGTYGGGAQSVARQYVYDAQQRLCKQIEPETGAALFAYDAAGNLAWSAEGTNLTTLSCNRGSVAAADKVLHSYDARNRLILVDYPDSTPDVSTSYHPDGAVHKVISGDVTLTYGYNRLGLLTSERLQYGSLNWLTQYGYTPLGHLATLTYRDGHQVSYAPNALGQPTQAGTYATGVTYHPNGAIKQFTYGNGIVHTLTQNARGLPERSRDALGATVVLDDSYDYDKNGNVLAISDGLTGQPGNRDMSYDALDRLLSVTAGSAQGGNGTFAYDALDNIRRLAQGSRDYRMEYDAANRNHQVRNDAGATVFTQAYDTRGNLVQRQWAGGPTDTFTFDRANRLTASTVGGLSSTYVYDGLGRRVREVTGESTYFQYSQDGKLLYTNDVKTQLRHNHIYLGGSLVAMRTVSFDGATSYIRYQHTDALGSPVAETDESGQVVRRERLTAWGEPVDGTWSNGPGFTGHRMDAASKLVYMQQRYYDPVIGRFLSVDPVTAYSDPVGQFNRYRYANNNPYRFTDPDGRYSCEASICAAVKSYVEKLRESRSNLRDRSEQRKVDQVLRYIGTEGSKGPHYKPGELKGDTAANTDQNGTTTIDVKKMDSSATGAMVIGHEARHDLDAIDRGGPAGTSAEVRATETRAYDTEATIGKGLGINISKQEQARGVNGSVKNWEDRQKPPEPKK